MKACATAVDLALVRNSSAFVAAYASGGIVQVGEIEEMQPQSRRPLKLSEVVERACAFAERHGQRVLHSDHHVLDPAREHLREGFSLQPVDASTRARTERFVVVRSLFNEDRIRIPACYSKLAQQLRDVVVKASSGGVLQIVLRSRGQAHSDLAAAFVIAVHQVAAFNSMAAWVEEQDAWAERQNRMGGFYDRQW